MELPGQLKTVVFLIKVNRVKTDFVWVLVLFECLDLIGMECNETG